MAKKKTFTCSNLCSHFSVLFLIVINALLGVLGVIIVGFAGYGFANFAEFEDLISQEAIIYSMCVGLILFLLSLLAIFGALNKMKKLLSVYVVVVLLLAISEVIIVILGLEYLGVISGVADAELEGSESLNSREAVVNDFLLRSYATCCVTDEELCNNIINQTNFCEPVQICGRQGVDETSVCIVNSDSVEPVDFSVCTAITKIDGEIISSPEDGGCGQGFAAGFLEDIATLIEDEFTSIGAGFAVIIFVEFLLILFTMFIILGKKVDYNKKMPWDDDTEEDIAVAQPVTREELLRLSVRNSEPIASEDHVVRSRQSANRQPRVVSVLEDETPEPQQRVVSILEEPTPETPKVEKTKKKAKRPKEIRMSIGRDKIVKDPNVINDII